MESRLRASGGSEFGLAQQVAILSHPVGQLKHVGGLERLSQYVQTVGSPQSRDHLVAGASQVSRTKHDLKLRIDFPDFGDGFKSIQTRRHAQINKRQFVRPSFDHRSLNHFQTLLALESGVDFKRVRFLSGSLVPKQRGFHVVQDAGTTRQNFAEILVRRIVVVDDNDSPNSNRLTILKVRHTVQLPIGQTALPTISLRLRPQTLPFIPLNTATKAPVNSHFFQIICHAFALNDLSFNIKRMTCNPD